MIELIDQSKTVVACRVSPKQKEEIVTLIRKEVRLPQKSN